MAVRFAFFVAVVGALVIAAAGATAAEPNLAAYGRLPLQFEPSSDEPAAPGEFVARGPGYSVRLTPAAATIRFRHSPQVACDHRDDGFADPIIIAIILHDERRAGFRLPIVGEG